MFQMQKAAGFSTLFFSISAIYKQSLRTLKGALLLQNQSQEIISLY